MCKVVIKRIISIAIFIGLSVGIAKEISFFNTASGIYFEEPACEKLHISAQLADSAFTQARMLADSIVGNLTSKSFKKDSSLTKRNINVK
ncbi:MAG: hypothetical protein LBQ22_02395 [Bacteroidales bacterium]|jgi:hypothetical protein|nr:hypothetical protein [Bacteroidales bacterium]